MQLPCMERKRCPRDEAGPVLGCTSGPGTLCFTMGTLPLASPPVVLTASRVEGTRRAASCPNRCCPHDYPAMCLHSSNLFLSLPASRGMWPWEKEGQALGEGWVLKSRTVTEMQWRVGIPSSGQVGHHWLLQGTRGKASAPLSPVTRTAYSLSLLGLCGLEGSTGGWGTTASLATYRKETLHSPVLPIGVPLRQRAAVNRVAVKGVIEACNGRRGMR